jgi:glutamyl-Q tRNA(Asp) synthetase
MADGCAKCHIARRKDIPAAETEHPVDFRRPGANAGKRHEPCVDVFVFQPCQRFKIKPALDHGAGKHFKRLCLGTRQAEPRNNRWPMGKISGRINRPLRLDAPPDGRRTGLGNHLRHDDMGKSLKARLGKTQRHRACSVHHIAKAGIKPAESDNPLCNICLALDLLHRHFLQVVVEKSMHSPSRQNPVFRFAPSPNGFLHLGHALSVLTNEQMAKEEGGRLLLRIEDIDQTRCRAEFEDEIFRDLAWLGLEFETPVRRQSQHLEEYHLALSRLEALGLVYPAFLTRGEVKAKHAAAEAKGKAWPRDPDGAPLYPPDDRQRHGRERAHLLKSGLRHTLRLDMQKALSLVAKPLTFQETGDGGKGTMTTDPAAWGDVVLSRSDAPSSYHLSVVVDDAAQGVTHVVRGLDLFHATSVHRLLQHLLGLPEPLYHHHRLVLGPDGRKLSKSEGSTGIAALKASGHSPADIRGLLGF